MPAVTLHLVIAEGTGVAEGTRWLGAPVPTACSQSRVTGRGGACTAQEAVAPQGNRQQAAAARAAPFPRGTPCPELRPLAPGVPRKGQCPRVSCRQGPAAGSSCLGGAVPLTQTCRWLPGQLVAVRPPRSDRGAMQMGQPVHGFQSTGGGLIENDSVPVIGAISAGKSSPWCGIPWLAARRGWARSACPTDPTPCPPRCRQRSRCGHPPARPTRGLPCVQHPAPQTGRRGSGDLVWDARTKHDSIGGEHELGMVSSQGGNRLICEEDKAEESKGRQH